MLLLLIWKHYKPMLLRYENVIRQSRYDYQLQMLPILFLKLYTIKLIGNKIKLKYPLVHVKEGEGDDDTNRIGTKPIEATVIETTARGQFRRPAPTN
jgi:hypothetical protein